MSKMSKWVGGEERKEEGIGCPGPPPTTTDASLEHLLSTKFSEKKEESGLRNAKKKIVRHQQLASHPAADKNPTHKHSTELSALYSTLQYAHTNNGTIRDSKGKHAIS